MRSDVLVIVCGDLPQRRDGSEQQAVRRISHLRRSAGRTTDGEKCRHLSRVWRELAYHWRIVAQRVVRSGEFVSPHGVSEHERIRHMWRVGCRWPDRWYMLEFLYIPPKRCTRFHDRVATRQIWRVGVATPVESTHPNSPLVAIRPPIVCSMAHDRVATRQIWRVCVATWRVWGWRIRHMWRVGAPR